MLTSTPGAALGGIRLHSTALLMWQAEGRLCEGECMALHDDVARLRAERIRNGGAAVPDRYQGVDKERIRNVLRQLHLDHNAELVDAVFALLDNETPSWFPRAPKGATIADGATTAHLGCHIGILQRGGGKLDREGRDYWIKPLRDLGGIEAITLHNGTFIAGHVVAKSMNSCYRLAEDFKAILQAPDDKWPEMLATWASADETRRRREFQARMAEIARAQVDTSHSDLIRSAIDHYAAQFLPGYQVLYVDDGDGDRIDDEQREQLAAAGIHLTLADAMPDVLLWNPETDRLWVIEAVTSDGEVDLHKVNQLRALATRCGKAGIDFTTVYRTWREAAARQQRHQNIAVGTYIWIRSDPAKHFLAESFP